MNGTGIFQTLWVTFMHIFRKKVTLRYPKQKQPMAERFFGLMRLKRDENGVDKCTGCGICALNCPTKVISMEKGKREDGKPYAVWYKVDIQRCMFCGICVEVCPFDALISGQKYELSSYTRDGMIYNKEDLLLPTGGAQ